jgi:hypothetical protein
MQPGNNKDNKVGESGSKDLPLLEEADELARIRNWTRPFALYIMFCQAMSVGYKIRASLYEAVGKRGEKFTCGSSVWETSKIKRSNQLRPYSYSTNWNRVLLQ